MQQRAIHYCLKKRLALIILGPDAGFLSLERENRLDEDRNKTENKLRALIFQIGRQTLVTLAKEGQLLCIPDKAETSASGENKHGVCVAPVCCWLMKPAAEEKAKMSWLNEWWCCERSGTTFQCGQCAVKPD